MEELLLLESSSSSSSSSSPTPAPAPAPAIRISMRSLEARRIHADASSSQITLASPKKFDQSPIQPQISILARHRFIPGPLRSKSTGRKQNAETFYRLNSARLLFENSFVKFVSNQRRIHQQSCAANPRQVVPASGLPWSRAMVAIGPVSPPQPLMIPWFTATSVSSFVLLIRRSRGRVHHHPHRPRVRVAATRAEADPPFRI